MPWMGLEVLENRALLSAGPTITSVTGSPDTAIRGTPMTVTANGITDNGGLIRNVEFFLDINGDGIFDRGDKGLGYGRLVAGTNNYSVAVHTHAWALGTNLILAVATDSNGNKNTPVEGAVMIENHPPHIERLEVVHNIAAAGNAVTLKALGITDPDAKIASVAFYIDSNNNGVPDSGELIGVDNNKAGGWTFTANMPDTLPTTGDITFLAVATGTDGTPGTVATATVHADAPPTVAMLSAGSNVIARSVPVTLTASDVIDSDGTVRRVSFYLDVNHDGILDAGDKSIGNGKRIGTDFVLKTTLPASTPTGPTTFFAVPVDNKGATGFAAPVGIGVTGIPASVQVTAGPAIGSLTSDSTSVVLGGSVTLTAANVVAEPGKNITTVEFFLDSNGNGKLDSKDTNLGAGTASGNNYQFVFQAPQSTSTTGATFFAVATDGTKTVDSSTPSSVHVSYAPSIRSLTTSAGAVPVGGMLTLTASNFTMVTGKTITQVEFFFDANGDGIFEGDTDQDIGSGTLVNGGYQLDVTIPSSLSSGPATFFAVAVDSDNVISPAASVGVTIRPSIGALSPNAPTVIPGDSLTLTASGVTVGNGGTAQSVEFFLDTNGDGVFEQDTDTDLGAGVQVASDGFQLVYTLPQNTPTGALTFFAVASDSNTPPITSPPASVQVTVIKPLIGSLTPSVPSAAPGDPLTLTASAISVGTGTVQGVEFFLDDGDGVFEQGVDTDLGSGTVDSNGNYELTFNLPLNTPAGTARFFAVVTNANNISGPPATAQLTVS